MNMVYERSERHIRAPIPPGMPSIITHVILALFGIAIGIIAAISTYGRLSSPWAAFFAFAVVSWAIGGALADVLTQPYPIRRLFYLALLPPLSAGVAVLAFDRWGTDWVAVLGGLIGGGIVHTIIGWIFFPRVMRTRKAGWNGRVDVYQERWGPLGPYNRVPRWYREWYRDQHNRERTVESDPQRKAASV